MQRLTEAQLRENAPAIFTENPRNDVTDKYEFVPSYQVIKDLDKLGWYPVSVNQSTNSKNSAHAKHMIKFQSDDPKFSLKNGLQPQALFSNSHDRSYRAVLGLGFFRLVCSNGLIIAEKGEKAEIIVQKHMGFTFPELQKRIEEMAIEFDVHYAEIQKYSSINLDVIEKRKFAKAAIEIRYGKEKDQIVESILEPQRKEDQADDLFTVFNVIQENLIKGGVKYKTEDDKNRSIMPLTEMAKQTSFNQALWTIMASTYSKLAA
jgi:hypothetical protein